MGKRITFTVHEIPFRLKGHGVHGAWLDAVAASHGAAVEELSYILVSDEYLLNMNQEYLKHNTYTDIITFPDTESKPMAIRGEVYISVDRVGENATGFGVPSSAELRRVMAHGLLHLIGFKDKTSKDVKEMRAAEDAALALWKEA